MVTFANCNPTTYGVVVNSFDKILTSQNYLKENVSSNFKIEMEHAEGL